MTRLLASLVLTLVALGGSVAAASNDGGTSAGEFLRLGAGAVAPATGDARTAAARGVQSLHYNPAGLAWQGSGIDQGSGSGATTGGDGKREVSATYQRLVLDINFGELAYAAPINGRAGWGAEVRYLDYGRMDRNQVNVAGGIVTNTRAGTFEAQDLAAAIGFGVRLETISGGVTGRLISSTLDGDAAIAGALDLGIQWRPASVPVEFGAMVANLGSDLRYDRDEEPLPRLLRVGAAARLWEGRVRLHVDGEFARNEDPHLMAGLELTPFPAVTFRGGYDGRVDGNGAGKGWTVGAGFRVQAFTLDYAYIPFGNLGDNHRVGLTFRF